MTSFALNYTRVQIHRFAQRGRPRSSEQHITITLTVALERNAVSSQLDRAALDRVLLNAFTAAAGGRRVFNGRVIFINFALNWVPAGVVETGRALGINLVPDTELRAITPSGADADGFFQQLGRDPSSPTELVIRRVYLVGDTAAAALRNTGLPANPQAITFANAASHEIIGHAIGVSHREGTVMGETNTSRRIGRLTNMQILTAVEHLLSEE